MNAVFEGKPGHSEHGELVEILIYSTIMCEYEQEPTIFISLWFL